MKDLFWVGFTVLAGFVIFWLGMVFLLDEPFWPGATKSPPVVQAPTRPFHFPREEVISYQRTIEGTRYDPYGFWGPPTEERGTIRIRR